MKAAQGQGRARPATPQSTFDRVAPYYDAVNTLLSAGFDRRWRRQAARFVASHVPPGGVVLDLATGTGALAVDVHRIALGRLHIVGLDLNWAMLHLARARPEASSASISLLRGDGTRLPFKGAAFDAVSIAFAIDDMPDRRACAAEAFRVLRPGGSVLLLELSLPDSDVVGAVYKQYLKLFALISRSSDVGYGHLRQEILGYRGRNAIKTLVTHAGFVGYTSKSLSAGVARLHIASKPLA